jgi:3-methyladenine DNA glycosylase AlkD
MSKHLSEIKKILIAKADSRNIDFFRKMVPGNQKIYGVKTPELNAIAKQYAQHSFGLAEELWASGALEEKIIAIKIMERTGKQDARRLLKMFKKFSAGIDNWAVCDGMGMQFLRGITKTHREEIFSIAKAFNKSSNFWKRRLSLVMVEWYTRHSDSHAQIKELVNNLEDDEEYYVKKAIAWIRRNLANKK